MWETFEDRSGRLGGGFIHHLLVGSGGVEDEAEMCRLSKQSGEVVTLTKRRRGQE